ncbi:MAG: FAD-dependent oxidoreductase [Clostridiales bacterium]|nr:FAD-dependent oxidoreductase [Clostridiales bacterium]
MNRKYDVIVAGGGLAGCCAAVSAAKKGMKVLLIERYGFLGGMATAALVNPFMPYNAYDKKGEAVQVNNAGLFRHILDELDARGSLYAQDKSDLGERKPNVWGGPHINHEAKHTFNEEVLKKILDEMLESAGINVLFHSFIFSIERKGATIKSISSVGKSGVLKHAADFFIDATGDADICALAENNFAIGREEDGKCQPMTLCFRICNADPYMAERIIYDPDMRNSLNAKYQQLQEEGKIKNQRENVLVFPHIGNGIIHFNSTRIINKNPLDPFELSKAEREARKQVAELVAFFKEHAPGFENCTLMQTAPQIGIRESRRIKGKYTLTENNLIGCVKFQDSIARGCYPVDIHNPSGKGTRIKHIPPGDYYTIPFRSMIPDNIDNVIVAGRPLSSTHEAHSAIRVMPICSNIGEAAGLAAALCVKDDLAPAEINIKNLQKELTEAGAVY